jgi:hypothetical protein
MSIKVEEVVPQSQWRRLPGDMVLTPLPKILLNYIICVYSWAYEHGCEQ